MKSVQVHTSNFPSVTTRILNDLNWHHSLNKSMPTLSDAMEIPPVIYTSDKAMIVMHCTEIQQKQCRYFHRYPRVEKPGKIYCRMWVGVLESVLLWGKPFCHHPGDAVTLQHHSQVCDSALPQRLWWPWRKFFVSGLGERLIKHKVTQHEQKTQLNSTTQFLSSGKFFWDFSLPGSKS